MLTSFLGGGVPLDLQRAYEFVSSLMFNVWFLPIFGQRVLSHKTSDIPLK